MVQPHQSLVLTADDAHLFSEGTWHYSYQKLGSHQTQVDGVSGFQFALWAPQVQSVSVVGSFNEWDVLENPLAPFNNGAFWQGFIPGVKPGDLYKFAITTKTGEVLYKADPYAVYAQLPPDTASVAFSSSYKWHDGAYMKSLTCKDLMHSKLNIFEVHLGSYKRMKEEACAELGCGDDHEYGRYLTYDELSEDLLQYVKEMGYTHIELMPIMEHPFDGSWGYQITGYFAPTSRYGNPDQFKHFVDKAHALGIGIILDWVPGGFCRDAHGLVNFVDGKLYEKEEHPNWGTFKFDLGRLEVRSFLISNLFYWLEEYHIDGIRVDGVTSMLYLNFGIDDPSQKKFNERGTEEDLDAIEFIQECNSLVGKHFPGVLMIAEESTAWPLVTYPKDIGGLGFHLKWDMGWMNDTLHYCQTDFPYRPSNHRLLTFTTMYQTNENFILPLSHDEVVHGKCSLITRMPGDYWRQFAGMRALALYQMCHMGAKLNFMGNEIAQFIEWRYYEGIEYFLAQDHEAHRLHQYFVSQLNKLYSNQPALWELAYDSEGFEWIDADNAHQSVISFVRHGKNPKDDLLVLLNFDVHAREHFRVGVPREGLWQEVFNSDAVEFGGSGVVNGIALVPSEEVGWNGRMNSLELRLPPLGGLVLKFSGELPQELKEQRRKERELKALQESLNKKDQSVEQLTNESQGMQTPSAEVSGNLYNTKQEDKDVFCKKEDRCLGSNQTSCSVSSNGAGVISDTSDTASDIPSKTVDKVDTLVVDMPKKPSKKCKKTACKSTSKTSKGAKKKRTEKQ